MTSFMYNSYFLLGLSHLSLRLTPTKNINLDLTLISCTNKQFMNKKKNSFLSNFHFLIMVPKIRCYKKIYNCPLNTAVLK
jgi:hypothetical protein